MSKEKIVIFIGGKKQSGKDTFANMFVESGFKRFAFADAMKEVLANFLKVQFYTTIDVEDFSNNKKKERYNLRFPFCDNQYSLRELMQWYGEMIKDKFGYLYWIKLLAYKILSDEKNNKIVISDVRYDYELFETQKLLTNYNCYSFYVDRGIESSDSHISETSLEDKKELFDVIIDNTGTLEDLKNKFENIKGYLFP